MGNEALNWDGLNDFTAKDAQERQKNKKQNKKQAKSSPVFHQNG